MMGERRSGQDASPASRLIGTPRKRTISAREVCHRKLSPNLGDGLRFRRRRLAGLRGRRFGGDFDPVGEPDTLNELGQLVVAIRAGANCPAPHRRA